MGFEALGCSAACTALVSVIVQALFSLKHHLHLCNGFTYQSLSLGHVVGGCFKTTGCVPLQQQNHSQTASV